jgi:hypothetical protein
MRLGLAYGQRRGARPSADLPAPRPPARRSAALTEAARIEATALADVSFGAPMLHAIGYVYQNKAEQFLGNPLVCGSLADVVSPAPYTSLWAAAEQKLHVLGTHAELGWAGVQAFLAAKAVADAEAAAEAERDGEGAKADVMAKVGDLLPNFVEALWRHTVLDIETTTRHVAAKVLWDRAASTQPRRLRARAAAMRDLGAVFCAVVAPAPRTAAQLVEEALRAAIFASTDEADPGAPTPPGTPGEGSPFTGYAGSAGGAGGAEEGGARRRAAAGRASP